MTLVRSVRGRVPAVALVIVGLTLSPISAHEDDLLIPKSSVPERHSKGRYLFDGEVIVGADKVSSATYFSVDHYGFKGGAERPGNVNLDVGIHYPSIRVGDVFPMFGQLRKVTDVGADGVRVRTTTKEETDGINHCEQTFPILLQRGRDRPLWESQVVLHGRGVYLVAIDEIPKSSPKRYRAKLRVWQGQKEVGEKAVTTACLREVVLEVGDIFAFREKYRGSQPKAEEVFGHEVLSITPPDTTTGAVGWIEFSEQIQSEKQLADLEQRVVRKPTPLAVPKRSETKAPASELVFADAGVRGMLEHGYGLGQAEDAGFGRHRAINDHNRPPIVTELRIEPQLEHPDDVDWLAMPTTCFANPKVGDVIPSYGRLYSVVKVLNTEVVVRVTAETDALKVVVPRPTSFVMGTSGSLHSRYLRLLEYRGTDGRTSARVRVNEKPEEGVVYVAEIAAGDYLVFTEQDVDYTRLPERELACKVLSVVPTDAKTGVVGWVEFEYPPVPVKKLDSTKATLVRPKRQ